MSGGKINYPAHFVKEMMKLCATTTHIAHLEQNIGYKYYQNPILN